MMVRYDGPMFTNPNPARTAPVDSTRRGLIASLLATRTILLPDAGRYGTDGTYRNKSDHYAYTYARSVR